MTMMLMLILLITSVFVQLTRGPSAITEFLVKFKQTYFL